MSRVPEDHPDARFCVTVWKAETSCFTTKLEAENEYAHLHQGGHFSLGELEERIDGPEPWRTLESFGFDDEDDEGEG